MGGFKPKADALSHRSSRGIPTHGPNSYDLDKQIGLCEIKGEKESLTNQTPEESRVSYSGFRGVLIENLQ